jgi:type II secretory pathway component PulK
VFSNCPDSKARQQGATLVLALIVVLVVVALATRISRDYFVLQRGLQNENELQQARAYLRGAESVAKQALILDLKSGNTTDSSLETWAQQQKLVLQDGVLTVCVVDLQSRLNLNDLGTPASEGFSAAQKRFIRLLQVVNPDHPLDEAAATGVANAVFDWADVDSQTRYPGGAEELDYLQQGHNFRPANQGFASVNELALVAGIDAELFAALTPLVSVWGNGNLNVNTLDSELLWSTASMSTDNKRPEPVLLRTLNNADSLRPLSVEAATLVASVRNNAAGVLKSLDVFRQPLLGQQKWDLNGIGVASDFFQMSADMQTGSHHQRLVSVLQRSRDAQGKPQIVVKSRTFIAGGLTGEKDCAAPLH